VHHVGSFVGEIKIIYEFPLRKDVQSPS